jgi:hypothetical protein
VILFGNSFPSGMFKDPKRFDFDFHNLGEYRTRNLNSFGSEG